MVKAEDRRYYRFLLPDKNGAVTLCEITHVTFGVSCSPFFYIRSTWQAADDAGPEVKVSAISIRKNMYVDDVLDCTRTAESGVKLARDMNRVLRGSEFHLQEFTRCIPLF